MADPMTLYHNLSMLHPYVFLVFLFIEQPELDLFLDLNAVKMTSSDATSVEESS